MRINLNVLRRLIDRGGKTMSNGITIPENIQQQLKDWNMFRKIWWTYHYTLGILAIIATITVATSPKFLQPIPNLIETLAWLAAILVALITFLTPSRRAKGYLAACQTLDHACTQYIKNQLTLQGLLDAEKKGEEMISQSDPI